MGAMRGTAVRSIRAGLVIGLLTPSSVALAAAPSIAAKPQALDRTSITAPADVIITYGDSVTISTTLTDTTTSSPIASAEVDLLARPADSTTYSPVGSATTDASGVANIVLSPTETGGYRWSYAGSATHHLATSVDGTVQVAEVVHAKLTKNTVKHGRHIEVYGTITPGGKSVELQRLEAGAFQTLPITARVKTQKLPNGKTKSGYILPFTPKQKGAITLRVIADDDGLNAGGTSRRLMLTAT